MASSGEGGGYRRAAWSAGSLFAVAIGCALIALVLRGSRASLGVVQVVDTVVLVTAQTVGWLVASRRPHNPVGWLLLALGLMVGLQAAESALVETSDFSAGLPPLALVLVGLVSKSYVLLWALFSGLFLLFPTGRLPGRAWRHPARLGGTGFVLAFVSVQLMQGPLDDESPVSPINPPNPLGLGGTAGDVLAVLGTLGSILVIFGMVASVASLVYRFWSSEGVERLQLKWFASAAAFFMLVLLIGIAVRNNAPGVSIEAVDTVLSLAFLTLPVSAGVAILKHRLYDIDVIINRTLVYGALTGFLALTYLALVYAFQQLFRPVAGESGIAVAASTLAVAALFRPARARIQAFIDRRFYRSKYDAAQTLETFSRRLRDEVDLEALSRELVGIVQETMHPAHVSLWLRQGRP